MQTPDFETLEQIAIDCENEPNFNFSKWYNCSRCAVGAFVHNHPDDELKMAQVITGGNLIPKFGIYTGITAVAKRLRIGYFQANRLFVPSNNPDAIEDGYLPETATKEEVAAKIRKFIASWRSLGINYASKSNI